LLMTAHGRLAAFDDYIFSDRFARDYLDLRVGAHRIVDFGVGIEPATTRRLAARAAELNKDLEVVGVDKYFASIVVKSEDRQRFAHFDEKGDIINVDGMPPKKVLNEKLRAYHELKERLVRESGGKNYTDPLGYSIEFRSKDEAYGLPNFRFVQSSFDFPADKDADLIRSFNVLMYYSRDPRVIAGALLEFERRLKEGGVFIGGWKQPFYYGGQFVVFQKRNGRLVPVEVVCMGVTGKHLGLLLEAKDPSVSKERGAITAYDENIDAFGRSLLPAAARPQLSDVYTFLAQEYGRNGKDLFAAVTALLKRNQAKGIKGTYEPDSGMLRFAYAELHEPESGGVQTEAQKSIDACIDKAIQIHGNALGTQAAMQEVARLLGEAFDAVLVSAPDEALRVRRLGEVVSVLGALQSEMKPYAPGWVAVMEEALKAFGAPGNRTLLADILRAKLNGATMLSDRSRELHHMLKNSAFRYFELRQMTLQEALDFAEVSLFYSEWVERMRRVTTAHFMAIPDETVADYFRQYYAGVEKLKEQALSRIDETKLSHGDLFLRLQETVRLKGVIAGRWKDFLEAYSIKIQSRYDKDIASPGRSPREWQEVFERYPGIELFYERALAACYRPLQEEESRLKKELLARIGKDPSIVRGIVRTVNASGGQILDPVMDWLLTLRVGETEKDIDWGSVEKRHGDEQYIYEGTPYGLIRDFISRIGLGPRDVFYDLGCGYGRILFYTRLATDAGLVKGVEIVPERVAECERIRERFGMRGLEIISQNIRDVDLRDGSVFFLFNPFISGTLDNVSLKLFDAARKRKIMIASYGACTFYFEDQAFWLKPLFSSYYNGAKVSLFESTIEPSVALPSTGSDTINMSVNTEELVSSSH
ncbi:MAG TPA: hypothetical protein P5287_05265, partial [bacterium]|nr:hypothetical protein [bacterium]